MITVKLQGARELAFDLNGMSRKLATKAMPEIVAKAGFEVEGRVKENLSGRILKVRSGHFHRAIHTILHDKGRKAGATITPGKLIYAPVHEFGALIRPKRVPYLKFKIPGVGWRSAKQVRIPARAPFAKSFKQSLRKIDRIAEAVVERAIK